MKKKIMSVNQNNGKNDRGKICLTNILSWDQTLGTKIFGFLLLCSFAVVFAACDARATRRDSCPNVKNEGIDTDGDGIDDACDPDDNSIDNGVQVPEDTDVDDDGDGLIEIRNEEMLGNIRYNLLGTGYKTKAQFDREPNPTKAPGNTNGCGNGKDITVCKGYELVPDGGVDTITLTKNWIPIVGDFTATFDGNGNTIKSLTIVGTATGANEEILGFFTYIGNNGIVQNLIIEEVMITGTATGPHSFTDSNSRTGSLAGELKANGQINGVKIINTDSDTTGISVSSSYVGGLVGLIDGATITNSYTTGSVTGAGRVGGLVGRISGSNTITNNYATGNVFGSDEYVGGLVGVGYNDSDTTITNSYATGSVTGGSAQVGGLVGYSDSTIMNSYATGNVRGSGYSVGGLAGYCAHVTNSYATGNVRGSGAVGGLVGRISRGDTITNSYATGSVFGSDVYIGGLVGWNYRNGIITKSYVHSTYTGTRLVGNLATDPAGVSKVDLTGLTLLGTLWPHNDWAFATDKFPTLRSYMKDANDVQEEGEILCGQDGDFNKDNVIDWIAPPAGQCGSL